MWWDYYYCSSVTPNIFTLSSVEKHSTIATMYQLLACIINAKICSKLSVKYTEIDTASYSLLITKLAYTVYSLLGYLKSIF